MRKQRLEPTLVENTILTVDGFEKVFIRLQQQVVLREQSKSTLNNYIRRIAAICLHFGKLPQEISDDEITEYLTSLALSPKSPSRSNFKHMVYGLRYYFRLMGDNKRAIGLPSLKKDTRLPVILNQGELRQLFKAPTLLKHRIVLSLIYSAGLRSQEAINLKISDIDFERKTIHIRQSKYKKDRIVPLSDMKKGLKKYLSAENPHIWLFNGKEPDGRYSVKGLSWVMHETGAICVLHTWGQNLSLHPHIHCIVPATGIDLKDKFKTIGEQGKYLYPEKMLNATFKGKMMQSLKTRIRLKGVLTQHQSTFNACI